MKNQILILGVYKKNLINKIIKKIKGIFDKMSLKDIIFVLEEQLMREYHTEMYNYSWYPGRYDKLKKMLRRGEFRKFVETMGKLRKVDDYWTFDDISSSEDLSSSEDSSDDEKITISKKKYDKLMKKYKEDE